MHSFEGLADEILTLLKNSGDSGDSGDRDKNTSQNKGISVTTCRASLSPLKNEWCHLVQSSGDGKSDSNQMLDDGVTTVTSVTTLFEQGREGVSAGDGGTQTHASNAELEGVPASWIDGVARLHVMDIPDCFTADRWRSIADDADAFLRQWGATASRLGWSAHDLFGVHPAAPFARFDAMGLVPVLHGNRVLALTETAATIRGSSGSIQRFSRIGMAQGICIWEVGR